MKKSTIAPAGIVEYEWEISGPGSVGAWELNPTLTPDDDAVPGSVSGDAWAYTVRPTVNISPHSVGPIGAINTHKWVGNHRLYLPKLQGGAGTGKPQSLVGLMILDPVGQDTAVEDALLEAYGLLSGTTLPSKLEGAFQIGNPGTRAQALKYGSGAGSRINSMLWMTGKRTLFPYGESRTGDAYTAWVETKVSTAGSGTHPNIAGAYVDTPEIETSGGARVDFYTTLRVGNAPKDGGAGFESTVKRALWVGTGPSEIEGFLTVGGLRILNSLAPTCSGDSSGLPGEIRWDNNYLYLKTGASTWKRVPLETFETE